MQIGGWQLACHPGFAQIRSWQPGSHPQLAQIRAWQAVRDPEVVQISAWQPVRDPEVVQIRAWQAAMYRSNAHELLRQAAMYRSNAHKLHWQPAMYRSNAHKLRWQAAMYRSNAHELRWQPAMYRSNAHKLHWQAAMYRSSAYRLRWQVGGWISRAAKRPRRAQTVLAEVGVWLGWIVAVGCGTARGGASWLLALAFATRGLDALGGSRLLCNSREVDVLGGSLLLCKSRGVDGLAGAVGSCGAMCARWLSVWVLVLGLLGQARADSASSMPSALASGVPCGVIGDCARFDALGIHVGAALGLGQGSAKSLALMGRTRVSVSLLDALDLSVSLAAQHDREGTDAALSVQPLSVGLRVRLWPWFDRAGPDVALSLSQSVPSRWLGNGDAVPETTASLAGTKLWRWLQLDGSAGVLWRDGLAKPIGVRVSGSGFVRLYQTPDPTLPRDSYRIGIQASALFPIERSAFLAATTALAVFEAATDRGLRFQLGFGAQTEGVRASGVALAQLSYSWGLRYRTGDGRAGRLGMPDWYLDYFMVDPILEADGCIYTDPSSLGRLKILCIGEPDPIDAGTIIHRDGRRFPVGLHVWIDKTDGTLMTADREILARPDEKTARLAMVVQQLVEVVRRREQKTGKPCFLRGGILHAVSDPSLAAMVAYDDQGGGASLLGYELARMIFCDAEPLAGGLPILPFGKGPRAASGAARQKVGELIEHEKPAALPAASTTKAAGTATEAAGILTEQSRKHLFEGEISKKRGNATGWHYEPTGNKEKGTYVIEGTRSPPDEHGVYAANVVIEGNAKKDRSTFFPKDWSPAQVESAIEEAYQRRKPEPRSGEFRGTTASGMEITLRLDGKGTLESAYPVYEGPRYRGPTK